MASDLMRVLHKLKTVQMTVNLVKHALILNLFLATTIFVPRLQLNIHAHLVMYTVVFILLTVPMSTHATWRVLPVPSVNIPRKDYGTA